MLAFRCWLTFWIECRGWGGVSKSSGLAGSELARMRTLWRARSLCVVNFNPVTTTSVGKDKSNIGALDPDPNIIPGPCEEFDQGKIIDWITHSHQYLEFSLQGYIISCFLFHVLILLEQAHVSHTFNWKSLSHLGMPGCTNLAVFNIVQNAFAPSPLSFWTFGRQF